MTDRSATLVGGNGDQAKGRPTKKKWGGGRRDNQVFLREGSRAAHQETGTEGRESISLKTRGGHRLRRATAQDSVTNDEKKTFWEDRPFSYSR